MVLTAAAIKVILDALTYAEPVHISDHVKPESRRKYPSIEVDNQGSELRRQDEQIQESSQRFLIHLYYRLRGDGSNDTANEKAIEDVIMAGLEAATLGGSKVFIEDKDWNRLYISQPIHYIDATITISVTDIASTTGSGRMGANQSLVLPGPVTINLLSKAPDDYGITSGDSLEDDGKVYVTPMANTTFGVSVYEYESTAALDTSIRALIDAKAKISVSLLDGVTTRETFDVLLIQTSKPTQYDQVERALLTLRRTG